MKAKTELVTVSAKGQVVIPVEMRRRLGLGPGSELEFTEQAGELRIRVLRAVEPSRVEDGFGMLRYRGPVRRLAEFDVARAMRGSGRRK